MAKQKWKAGNMVYPLPAVMVSCGDKTHQNIITIAWTGTICTNPPMTYISVRPTRASYQMIKESGYFVINLTTKSLVYETDFCGVKSGKDVDKFTAMGLSADFENESGCPMIAEAPVNIECRVVEVKELGSHHMFIAEVVGVYIDEKYLDEKGKFHLNSSSLIAYSHGSYFTLGEQLGTFGYSIKKEKPSVSNQKPESLSAPKKQESKKTPYAKQVKKKKTTPKKKRKSIR